MVFYSKRRLPGVILTISRRFVPILHLSYTHPGPPPLLHFRWYIAGTWLVQPRIILVLSSCYPRVHTRMHQPFTSQTVAFLRGM